MKLVNNKNEKIGLAISKGELNAIVDCVEEVALRMETSADKGWGTPFIMRQVNKLRELSRDLRKIREDHKAKETNDENCEVTYEGLPKEDCENCD